MAKGHYSQGVCLLTDGTTTLEDIESALQKHNFTAVNQLPATDDWRYRGPSIVIEFRSEVNGYALVDLVNQPWPDGMGDRKDDPATFGAWVFGNFGPFAFPGGLARAAQHAWAWQPGRMIANTHRGFVRIRLSYLLGAKPDDVVLPANYDPLAEMLFLTRAVLPALEAPGIICYFNPNGEVLRDGASFREVWTARQNEDKLPLPLWMNIRFFKLNEKYFLMDTVGNSQLDLIDVEAIFPLERYEPGDVDYYLRNVTHYLLELDREIKTGENIDGPGENNLSWSIEVLDRGEIVEPPRRVLRLYPTADRHEILEALAASKSPRV